MAARSGRRKSAAPTTTPERVHLEVFLGGLGALAFLVLVRLGVGAPWGYDDYYHLGVARELGGGFLRAFPWTPFSILSERYADKEVLFHLLLWPLANLPVERAAAFGALFGQAALVGAFAFFLVRLRVPHPGPWLLALGVLGPIFLLRLQQTRPHVWLLAGCVVVVAQLAGGARWWALAGVTALLGLLHTAGWVAVFIAGCWWLAQRLAKDGSATTIPWLPLAAAGGWLAGQLVHPNLPRNLELTWTQNVLVPLSAAGSASRSLQEAIGIELSRPSAEVLFGEWPAFVAPGLALLVLLTRRSARTASALALALVTAAFFLAGMLWMRRLLEMGAVFGLLWLALVMAEARRRGEALPWPGGRRLAVVVWLVAAGVWVVVNVRDLGRGDRRPLGRGQPLGMARFLAGRGAEGDLVFTAQWADSSPLFHTAPQLRTLVALDPTFFALHDPRRFERYWAIAHGRSGRPVEEIQHEFGARFVTVWKAPGFMPLARQLRADRRAQMVYSDPYYEVWELTAG